MSHITTTDNAKLHAKDCGSGRPVMVMPSSPLNADSWDDQAMAIANAGHSAIEFWAVERCT